MALQEPVPGSTITQRFGPSPMAVQPSMWSDGARAAWSPFAKAKAYDDFHNGVDKSAGLGTAILAGSAGVIERSAYDSNNGGGHVVELRLPSGLRLAHAHMSSRAVRTGQRVARGQLLGRVGSTGYSTGPHDHHTNLLYEVYGGVLQTYHLNPLDFLAGGKYANHPLIAASPPDSARVRAAGLGINCRTAPRLASQYLYASTRATGWIRFSDGARLGDALGTLRYYRSVPGDPYDVGTGRRTDYAEVWLGGAKRYIARALVRAA